MKRMKSIGSMLLAIGMMCGLLVTQSGAEDAAVERPAEATGSQPVAQVVEAPEVVNGLEPEQMIEISDPGIIPYVSETPLESAEISEDGLSWYQKKGYTAYRVWVQNDTNQVMKVTVTYTGMPSGKSLTFNVQPGKGNGIVVNNAWEGVQHYIDFQTGDGTLKGACSVRISDTPFG